MGKIYGSALELIGNTPLVEVKNVEKSEGLEATAVSYTHLRAHET